MADRIPLTLADLEELLTYISPDDRDIWWAVGAGIKAEFGEAGFDVWDRWSQAGDGYKAADARSVWRSNRKRGIGMGTVIKLARDNGWSPRREPMTREERRRLAREAEERRHARQAELEADEARLKVMQERVAAACERVWNEHCKPEGKSAYLRNKQVAGYGVGYVNHAVLIAIDDEKQRVDIFAGHDVITWFEAMPEPRPEHISFLQIRKGDVVIPLRDEAGKLWSLQVINAKGTKLFPKYSRKAGCFHLMPTVEMATIAIGEGYATVASVREAMGWAGVVALDSGNLPAVARAVRAMYPEARIVLVGDDDTETAGNPGRTKAEQAAGEVGGLVAFPAPTLGGGGDWNDLRVTEGLGAVVRQLEWVETAELPSPKSSVREMLEAFSAELEAGASPAPSTEGEAQESAGDSSAIGGAGEALTAEEVLRRYALVEGTTNVWDCDRASMMKRTAFELRVSKALAKEWFDNTSKRLIAAEQVREIEQARRMSAKKDGALSMPPLERYVYIDGTKDVWDRQKKRRVPEGAVKMALGDAYSLWLNSPERRVVDVDHIVFDPTMTKDPSLYINTFEGLPLEPVRDDAACANLRWLISFLCNHDEEAFNWLVRWMAYPLQHPGAKMDTAVLAHSTMEGSGKSLLFADVMGELYGQYAAVVGQTQLESSFNAWQSRKLWAVFEEVVSRDQRYNQVGKIKHLVTGKTVRMESKFINGWEEANHMNAVFLSNEIMPWPISENDRRLLVLWPAETLSVERQRAIGAELQNGGVAALYGWLLSVDLGDFDQRTRPPKTEARERLVALSRAGWQTFLHLWRLGDLGPGLWAPCLTSDLYALYIEWCQRNRENTMSQTKFSLMISAEVPKTRAIPWTDRNTRRFAAFFFPSTDPASPPPSLTAAALGQAVDTWRTKARESGWNVDGWDHIKGMAA